MVSNLRASSVASAAVRSMLPDPTLAPDSPDAPKAVSAVRLTVVATPDPMMRARMRIEFMMAPPTLAVSVTVPLLLLAVNGSQVRLLMAAAALSPTTVAVSPVTSANEKVSPQVSISHTPDAAAVVAKINFSVAVAAVAAVGSTTRPR